MVEAPPAIALGASPIAFELSWQIFVSPKKLGYVYWQKVCLIPLMVWSLSHSLQDNSVCDAELCMVLDEVAKYSDMKKDIHLKAHHAHVAVATRLVAQGRKEARADLLKAMGGNSYYRVLQAPSSIHPPPPPLEK